MDQRPAEILVADDDAAMREMVGEVLREAGFTVRAAQSGSEALASVRSAAPTLAVLDYRMGEPNGLEVCRVLKGGGRTAHIPVLILTGQSGIDDRIEGFDAGADDYLAKPFEPRELLARVRALLKQVERSLHRNPTTGLPGGDAIALEYERRRADGTFAICYFDLDHFKPFGDRFGFSLADETIRAAGHALAAAAGEEGFVGHIGGDDFVLICEREEAVRRCEEARVRFDERVRELVPASQRASGSYVATDREGRERSFPLTRLSVAVVILGAGSPHSLAELGELIAAEKRRAKETGVITLLELDAVEGGA
jgi:PleD family two-component response regulator